MHILHGTYHDTILLTLDVTQRLWTLVVKGALVAPIELPIIKQLAYQGYLLRAKYRDRIPQCLYRRFAIGTKTCVQGTC